MRIIYRWKRRRALRSIRATMATMGRDPGDLLVPRNYRGFLKGTRRVAKAMRDVGASAETVAVAMREFGRAARAILTPPQSP